MMLVNEGRVGEVQLQKGAQLALDAINGKTTRGIPSLILHVMDWDLIEEMAGHPPGSYPKNPVEVYLDFQRAIGATMCDQWIPENPLTIRKDGYDSSASRNATTGVSQIVCDGMVIDSPEAAVGHMEKYFIPRLQAKCKEIDENVDAVVASMISKEADVQALFGAAMLKVPYHGFQAFPRFLYGTYGYESYFMAYALYPEVIERIFSLQADLAVKQNTISARAIIEGGMPRLVRLDHDMADSRGMLVDIATLDRMWLPHFARAIKPMLDAGIRLIWHCDGNLMDLFPRLLESGVGGFQGFQYEDGMDYEKICKMKTREGGELLIMAGVSVTRTLPNGSVEDVKRELQFLVKHGPRVGLILGGSSSIAPKTRPENIKALAGGLRYYQEHGRG